MTDYTLLGEFKEGLHDSNTYLMRLARLQLPAHTLSSEQGPGTQTNWYNVHVRIQCPLVASTVVCCPRTIATLFSVSKNNAAASSPIVRINLR